MRLDLHVHHDRELRTFLREQENRIMTKLDDLKTQIEGLTSDLTELGGVIDAFIASDAANFQQLKDALDGSRDPGLIQAALDQIAAARATLASTKEKIVAADAADNLPTP
jgi:hypothetical protein